MSAEEYDPTQVQRRTTSAPTSNAPAPAVANPGDGDTHALPNGTRLDEFELTQRIGEGGFSIVYLAWDHSLDRKVAVKEYMPGSLAACPASPTIARCASGHARWRSHALFGGHTTS